MKIYSPSSLVFSPISTVVLTFVIAFILLASNFTIIYAQIPPQQQQAQSDGGFTASLNRSSFARGDTITVSGTVGEREPNSNVLIRVIDPQSNEVEAGLVDVTADNTFTYSFVAGEQEEFDSDEPMVISGNYRVIVSYITPDFDNEAVELTFAYNTSSQTAPGATSTTNQPYMIEENAPRTTIRTFQSTNDSFSVQIPNGWIINRINVLNYVGEDYKIK